MLKRKQLFRYSELTAILRTQIHTGYIKPGEFLLPEHELSNKYGISRTSVRKALQDLLDEQLIVKMPGKGSIVNPDWTPPEPADRRLTILSPYPSYFAEKALPVVIDMFKAQYPHIEVQVISVPFDSETFLQDLGRAGMNPDLVLVTDRDFKQLDDAEFTDLTHMVDPDSDVPAKLTGAFMAGGSLFAVPVTYSPIFLIYNKQLFAQYGIPLPHGNWTMDDFMHAAAALTRDTDGDGLLDLYGIGLSAGITRWVDLAIKNKAISGAVADLEALTQSLLLLQDLLYRDRVAPVFPLNDMPLVESMFHQQRIAMQLTSLLAIQGLDPLNHGIAAIPFGSSGSKLLIANGLMMYAKGNQPDYAKLFLKFILDRSVQQQWSASANLLAIYRQINAEYWGEARMQLLDIAENEADEDRFMHEIVADPRLLDDIVGEMKMFWSGMETPAETARKIKSRLEEL